MTATHKTCYRCERPVRDLVNPADVLGGTHGACDDCKLTVAATEVAREWRMGHPDDAESIIPREVAHGDQPKDAA